MEEFIKKLMNSPMKVFVTNADGRYFELADGELKPMCTDEEWKELKKEPTNSIGLQRVFYDTVRFDSEDNAGSEVYIVDYIYPKMMVTDPCGNVTELPLNYRPVAGLDFSDMGTLNKFFDIDMGKRDSIK